MSCHLRSISQNPYACEEKWVLTFVGLILSLVTLVSMVTWMIRTSYLLKLQRESALLDDVVLGNEDNTCSNCGSITGNDGSKIRTLMQLGEALNSLEQDLPSPQICKFCMLISTVKNMAIFETVFLSAGFLGWFFGYDIFLVWFCIFAAAFYTSFLGIIFLWTFFSTSPAIRSAMLCIGSQIRRSHHMLQFENSRESVNASSEAILSVLPREHIKHVIKLLRDDETILYAESLDFAKYSYRNYNFALIFSFLSCCSPVFIALGIYGAVRTAAIAATLPFLIAALMWMPFLNDVVTKGSSSYVITNKRAIQLTPGMVSKFFQLSSSSMYFAKMNIVLIQKLGREEDSSVGKIMWMQDTDATFTRLHYVSDVFQVAKIIHQCHPKQFEDESLEQSENPPELELPPFEKPDNIGDTKGNLNTYWYARIIALIVWIALVPIFWLLFRSFLGVVMGIALGALFTLFTAISYQRALFLDQTKIITLKFSRADTLPSQQT